MRGRSWHFAALGVAVFATVLLLYEPETTCVAWEGSASGLGDCTEYETLGPPKLLSAATVAFVVAGAALGASALDWRIRSRWDYLAFPAVLAWAAVAAAVVLVMLGLLTLGALALAAAVALAIAAALLTPLATVYGSRSHGHMDLGAPYHVAAFLLGPVVGVHYLWRTRREGRPT